MDIDELEKLAKGTEPGPWYYQRGTSYDHWELWNSEYTYLVQDNPNVEPSESFLKYIAAANPQTVLKLIAVVKAAKKDMAYADLGDHEFCFSDTYEALKQLEASE